MAKYRAMSWEEYAGVLVGDYVHVDRAARRVLLVDPDDGELRLGVRGDPTGVTTAEERAVACGYVWVPGLFADGPVPIEWVNLERCSVPESEPARDPNGADTDTKPSNPKDAAAFGRRVSLAVLPLRVLVRVALAFAEGDWKYGRHNYRPAGVRASVYFDAAMRHLWAWFEGQDIDPGSRLSHIDKAIAGLMVLRDSMLQGNMTDDRPPSIEGDIIEQANAEYVAMGERMAAEHGPRKAPFTRGA